MPTTLAGMLVLLFVALPGVPGEKIYRIMVGANWRDQPWQKALRLLGFSFFGLAIYTVVASWLAAPLPGYLTPDQLAAALSDSRSTPPLFLSFLGHFLGSAITGLTVGFSIRSLRRAATMTPFYSAWDHFIYVCVARHWVLVSLKNGEAYAGILELADTSVALGERDLILEEPAIYDEEKEVYIALGQQYLFIPGDTISGMAAVYDPSIDTRETTVGEAVFGKERRDDLLQGKTSETDPQRGTELA
jgi:small nuclear ribonucleoprotein (snRNP)-like protein